MKFYRRSSQARQADAEQSPVILTCTILPGSHLKAYRLLIVGLDPIERRRCTDMFVDHVRNLSSSLESVVFLSTLLFDTYSFSEVYLCVEKLFQCRRNHRIKHLVVGEIPSPCNRLLCHEIVY